LAFLPFAGGKPSVPSEVFASGLPGWSPLMNPNERPGAPLYPRATSTV